MCDSGIVGRIIEKCQDDGVKVSITSSWFPDGRERYTVWVFPEDASADLGISHNKGEW